MFCSLRARFGSNNNPSAKEFSHAYKRLLLHQEIRGNRGNCIIRDITSILRFPSEKTDRKDIKNRESDTLLQKRFALFCENNDHDYSILSHWPILTEYQTAVLEYIAGFCTEMAAKLIKCQICKKAVYEETPNREYELVNMKDRGGLRHVNSSVKVICEVTEKMVRKITALTQEKAPIAKNISTAVPSAVLQTVLEQHD